MALPLVPIAAVAVAAYAVQRAVRRSLRPGRTDQRAEDAMDDMAEGITLHRPADRGQTNATTRLRRRITIGTTSWDVDAAALFRFRIRKV